MGKTGNRAGVSVQRTARHKGTSSRGTEYLKITVKNVLLAQVFETGCQVLQPVPSLWLRNASLLPQIIAQVTTTQRDGQ